MFDKLLSKIKFFKGSERIEGGKEGSLSIMPSKTDKKTISCDIANIRFAEQNLSSRLVNSLQAQNITQIKDIFCYKEKDIFLFPSMGAKTLKELKNFLYENGVELGITYEIIEKNNFTSKNPIKNIEEGVETKKEIFTGETEEKCQIFSYIADTRFDEEDLPARLINALRAQNIIQIRDILSYTEKNLALFPNMGVSSREELREFLFQKGIQLGKPYEIVEQKRPERMEIVRKCSFESFIKERFPERVSNILLERYSGKTLEEIAQALGLTRERVRQICSKLKWEKINIIFEEDKYRNLFEKYKWTKESFCTIFQEKSQCYYYLKYRYNRGQFPLKKFISEEVPEVEKERCLSFLRSAISTEGKVILRKDFLEEIIKHFAQQKISIKELSNKYNSERIKYPELQLVEIDEKALRSRLQHRDDIVWCGNSSIRYYDFENLSTEMLEKLLPNNPGFYSTQLLFENNKELMDELKIKNKNELHSILKRIVKKEYVTFTRMPGFLIGGITPKEFLFEEIKRYSPISIDEFADILETSYGHDRRSMISHLFADFSKYIHQDLLNIETETISSDEIDILRPLLTEDIYLIEDFKKIINFKKLPEDKILHRYSCQKLGYTLKEDCIISSRFTSTKKYLEYILSEKGILNLSPEIMKTPSVYSQIYVLQREMRLFKLDENIFVSMDKLKTIGISEDDIKQFLLNIKELFAEKDYFSIYNVLDEVDVSKFEEKGLSEKFLENFLSFIPEIKTLRISSNKLFSFSDSPLQITAFMRHLVGQYSKITISDISREILRKYQINISIEKVREFVLNIEDVFYSDILEKVYIDKEDYYKEIYNG